MNFSEQQLIDCGSRSCGSTNAFVYYQYVKDFGIEQAKDYPYTGLVNICNANPKLFAANITQWGIVPRDEPQILSTIVNVGPVVVGIGTSGKYWQFYSGGVFTHDCENAPTNWLLAVGFDKKDFPPYYILKNSYGDDWGEGGYMKLLLNANQCGVADYASYPVI